MVSDWVLDKNKSQDRMKYILPAVTMTLLPTAFMPLATVMT